MLHNQIFVAIPFNATYEPVWRTIRLACQTRRLTPLRVDQSPAPGDIPRQIQLAIRDSLFLVADLSDLNANVAFEAGFGTALGKALVLLVRDYAQLPFDLRHLRAIRYDAHPKGLVELQGELVRTFDYLLEQAGRSGLTPPGP